MRRSLFVGCPMWAHRRWVGTHLPSTTTPGTELAAYSRVVNAVEGNTTFYASPTPATVLRWADAAAPGFRFVFKAPREATHDRRLRNTETIVAEFAALLEPLGALLGGITFQLPASFGPGDLDALDGALRRAPGFVRWSVEVRHPDFFDGSPRLALTRLLARHRAEQVLLDSRALFARPPRTAAGREAWENKPRVPALAEALTDRPVVRFIGSDHDDLTAHGLAEWAPIVATWLRDGREPCVFVHTPDNADSPGLARGFHTDVGLLVSDLEALPARAPSAGELEQPTLF